MYLLIALRKPLPDSVFDGAFVAEGCHEHIRLGLSDAADAACALVESCGRPRGIEVDEGGKVVLEVESLGGGVGSEENREVTAHGESQLEV